MSGANSFIIFISVFACEIISIIFTTKTVKDSFKLLFKLLINSLNFIDSVILLYENLIFLLSLFN